MYQMSSESSEVSFSHAQHTDIAVTVFNIVHHYNRSVKQVINGGG